MSPRSAPESSLRMRSSGRRGSPGRDAPRDSLLSRVALAVVTTVVVVGWTLTAAVPAVVDIGLATGLTGAPGDLTVQECHLSSSSKYRRRLCTGSFVYDATGERVAVDAFSWGEPGQVYPARITAGRDRAGARGAQGALAALLFPSIGLFFMALMGMVLGLRFFVAAVICAVGAAGLVVGFVATLF